MGDVNKRCEQAVDLVLGSVDTADGQVVVVAVDGKGRTFIHTKGKRENNARLDGDLSLALRFVLNALDVAYIERIEKQSGWLAGDKDAAEPGDQPGEGREP